MKLHSPQSVSFTTHCKYRNRCTKHLANSPVTIETPNFLPPILDIEIIEIEENDDFSLVAMEMSQVFSPKIATFCIFELEFKIKGEKFTL